MLAEVEAIMPTLDLRISECAPDWEGAMLSMKRYEASVAMQVGEDKDFARKMNRELVVSSLMIDQAKHAARMEAQAKLLAKDPVYQVKTAAKLLPRSYEISHSPEITWASHSRHRHYDPGPRYSTATQVHLGGGTVWFQ